MGCLFGRYPHIGNSRADILGANIKAIEIFDGFANFMHQLRCRVIGQYGTFTAAKVQPSKAGLVRHTLAEPQGIDQGSVFTLIGKDTTAAQRRAEFCAMDRYTTIKLIIIAKYHHSFITIGRNFLDGSPPQRSAPRRSPASSPAFGAGIGPSACGTPRDALATPAFTWDREMLWGRRRGDGTIVAA